GSQHREHQGEDTAEEGEPAEEVVRQVVRQEHLEGRPNGFADVASIREVWQQVREQEAQQDPHAHEDPCARAIAQHEQLRCEALHGAMPSASIVSSRKTSSREARSERSSETATPAVTSARLMTGVAAASAVIINAPSSVWTLAT